MQKCCLWLGQGNNSGQQTLRLLQTKWEMCCMQADKAKLERELAALQVKLDTREVQYQDAVRQLNISKFMLSESDEARDEVSHTCMKCSTKTSEVCKKAVCSSRSKS